MTNRTPLDYDSIMAPSIHDQKSDTCGLCGRALPTPQSACANGCTIADKPVPDAEREAFERWRGGHGEMDMPRMPNGDYRFRDDEQGWAAWQARARLSPAIPVEALDSAIDLMQREADACDSQAKMFDNPDVARSYSQLAINYREGAASLHKLLESAK